MRELEGAGWGLQGARSKTGKEQDGPMIRREQEAEGSIINNGATSIFVHSKISILVNPWAPWGAPRTTQGPGDRFF